MKRKEQYIVRLDEVIITREGDSAVIRYKEEGLMTTHLKIGPEISSMSDGPILELFNDTLRACAEKMKSRTGHRRNDVSREQKSAEWFT